MNKTPATKEEEQTLFSWRAQRAAEPLETGRAELLEEIAHALPRSHKRIVLEARLRDLTIEALKVEREI